MADLAFGISKTAIQLLKDKVKSAIKEEAEQWQTVERDLVFITGEFEMMQSFLDTVTKEHVNNKIVRTWVRQVRDLSNDVEDNIDFVLHIDTKKRSWWLRLLPSCGKTRAPLPVDQAVAETKLLRARVVDVSQRNIRYNLIVDSDSRPMAAKGQVPVQKTAVCPFAVLINAVKKSGLLDLVGLIAREDRDLHVVSVCGIAGDLVNVGIVRKMYSDSRIHRDFQCRAWVKLMYPFNPHEFLQSLMTQFFTHSCQEQEDLIVGLDALERMQQATQGDLDLMKEFAQKVNTHRYLIVLEDMYTIVQWDAIRSYLPDRKKGSRIVVLTHHPVLASQCTGEPCRVSDLWQFWPGYSVRVYYKEGFQHDRAHSFIKAEPYHSLFNNGLLGRDTEMNELFEQTQNIQESRLISVWGMPGVGKSALVDAIYRQLRTSDDFKRHAWVNVSHPFNPTDFSQSLLVDLLSESTSLDRKYSKAIQAEDPIKECRDHICDCVCLFVIDGVQSNEEWDWIKSNLIQYVGSRSCIIIITREKSVAKHCAVSSVDGTYNIKGLHAAATAELFQKVFKESESCRVIWTEEGRATWAATTAADHILPKCGGLPRVITTLARYMASKPKDVFEQKVMGLSDNFLHELATNPEFDSLRDIQAWMHSYFHACPRYLKKYMLYLSIFPQDIIIRRRRLVRRWIAEGYSKGTDSISMDKYAEKIFDLAAALSIMQPVLEVSKVTGYRVNGFFREHVMSRPVEETIFFPVEVSALEKGHGHGRLTTEGIGQHLAIGSTWEEDWVFFQSSDFSRLRSFTLFGNRFGSTYVSDRMRVLRVLDLENAMGVNDSGFERIGKLPSRLKFLSLRGQRDISRLPDSVGDLVQLQTLDIRGTKIRTLPPFITKLRKLQYIRAGTTVAWTDDADEGSTPPSSSRSRTLASCLPNKFLSRGGPVVGFGCRSCGGVEVPRGIKRLEALQTLGAVCVNTADAGAILDEIVSLLQLKKLEVSGISWEHARRILPSLYGRTHLESLTLQFVKSSNFVHWENICLPRSLRSLKIYGHVKEVPERTLLLDNLVKLTIEMSTLLTTMDITNLGRSPSLRTLRLRINRHQDGELQFPTNDLLFRKLQLLEIACKSKLHVKFGDRAMGKVELLKLHCLEGSEMQFSGLEHPVSLKQVWLLGSFNDTLKEALQQQLVKHPKKPSLMLEDQPRSLSQGPRW